MRAELRVVSGGVLAGFMNLATEELCARWIAVGAFYPYARMHHAQGFQELYRWPKVAEAARKVLQARYRALPYLYTAFWQAHRFGCPIARPLLFAAPSDAQALVTDGQVGPRPPRPASPHPSAVNCNVVGA